MKKLSAEPQIVESHAVGPLLTIQNLANASTNEAEYNQVRSIPERPQSKMKSRNQKSRQKGNIQTEPTYLKVSSRSKRNLSNGRKKSIVEAETLYTQNTYMTKVPSARAISTSSI